MLNLSHSVSESEIPENFESESMKPSEDATLIVQRVFSAKEKVINCLQEAGGDSLTISEIAELTDVAEDQVKRILRHMSSKNIEEREVFEDENAPGAYFITEPMLDRLATGF